MSGTDHISPRQNEPGDAGLPSGAPPAPPRAPAPAVHVAGPGQALPDDAPTSLLPVLGSTAPPPTEDTADATRIAAPLARTAPVAGPDATQYLPRVTGPHPAVTPSPAAAPPAAAPPAAAPPAAAAPPTRTPSYSARRTPVAPPSGPYGGLYAGPLDGTAASAMLPVPEAAAPAADGQPPVPPPPAPALAPVPVPVPSFGGPGPGQAASAPPIAVPHAALPGPAAPRPARPVPGPRRGGLVLGRVEPRVAVLGGVVGLLVVAAVVLGFTLFGGSGSPGGTPSAEASASTGTAAEPVVTERFAAPSRNITCTMTATEATCSIAQLTTKPTPVDGCDGTVGYVAKLAADGTVETPCIASKDQPAAASSKVTALGYGKSVTVGALTCSSSETGVECRAKGTGKGFTIARAGIRTR